VSPPKLCPLGWAFIHSQISRCRPRRRPCYRSCHRPCRCSDGLHEQDQSATDRRPHHPHREARARASEGLQEEDQARCADWTRLVNPLLSPQL